MDHREAIIFLYKRGFTLARVAEQVGCSIGAVYYHLTRSGRPRRRTGPRRPESTHPLRAWLTRSSMTESDLARQAGCSLASISRYLSGERYPRQALAEILSQLTGIPIDQLIRPSSGKT